MMFIFIDTNIFFNNWYLRSPNFQLLANFSNNTNATLLIPNVVCEEIDNKFKIEMKKTITEAKRTGRKASNFCKLKFNIDLDQFPKEKYIFSEILEEKFKNVDYIPYEKVTHSTLVKKALCGIRPFRDSEKGYRDALIWHSLIDYIIEKEIKDNIVFICNNSSDFFEPNNSTLVLHGDLRSDIEAKLINNDFVLYSSLKSFIESNVKENLHKFQHDDLEDIDEKFGELFEEFAEEQTYYYMKDLSIQDLRSIFEDSGYSSTSVEFLRDFRFEIEEGMEDPEILSCSKISDEKIYFDYSYNLRSCTIQLELLSTDYFANKTELDRIFYNAEIDGAKVTLYAYERCYYNSNFIFNILDEAVEQFVVNGIYMK